MSLNEKHIKGIRAELLAQEYFVDKGYKVFRALHGVGPIDFITLDNENNIRYFDVKTNAKRSDGTKICRTNNKVPGLRIEIVYVDLVTSEVREHSFDKGEWHNNEDWEPDYSNYANNIGFSIKLWHSPDNAVTSPSLYGEPLIDCVSGIQSIPNVVIHLHIINLFRWW